MTDEDYFSIDAISNSKLSAFNRCPANLFVEKDNTFYNQNHPGFLSFLFPVMAFSIKP